MVSFGFPKKGDSKYEETPETKMLRIVRDLTGAVSDNFKELDEQFSIDTRNKTVLIRSETFKGYLKTAKDNLENLKKSKDIIMRSTQISNELKSDIENTFKNHIGENQDKNSIYYKDDHFEAGIFLNRSEKEILDDIKASIINFDGLYIDLGNLYNREFQIVNPDNKHDIPRREKS